MNDNCLVSILCTAFNHESYIRQTLESFLSQQTDFPFEVLVNDDCSTDATAAIIREFAGKYPGVIRPFYQEKNLFSQGVNLYDRILYPNARGKYFAFCEGDDFWTDTKKLQTQFDFMEAHPDYAACVHNTVLSVCDGKTPDTLLLADGGDRDVDFDRIITGMQNSFHTSSIFARAELFRELPDYYRVAWEYGFLDQAIALWLRSNGRIRLINRPMSVYRISSGASSWSSGISGQYGKLLRFVKGKIALLTAFRKHVPEEYAALTEEYILRHEFELMYIEGRDREQRRPPYRAFLKEKPFSYRLNNTIKSCFPWLQTLYRTLRGYHE